MLKKALLGIALSLPLTFSATHVDAAGLAGFARGLDNSRSVEFIRTRARVLAPFAHVKFCKRNPSQCAARGGSDVVQLDAKRSAQMRQVNSSVNRKIRPVNDRAGVGGDVWQVNATRGDCEDFALTKRAQLISLGWSPRALRMAVVYTPSGEGHAVLVVKTSKGDMVLDNRTSAIRNWRETDLRWVKIQSGDNPRQWMSL